MTAETGDNAGPVFLVVDDDPMVRRIVTRGLTPLNPSRVLEVEDGLEAQSVLQDVAVDVVVTDVVMPNMDGLELMKWAQEHCPDPLWIILSGLETFDAAVEALQSGAFDYLAKPPEVPRVRVAVRNALDQIELVRERRRLYAQLESSNAQLAEKVAQLQQACHVLEDQAAVIQADLDRAEIIQRALLPQSPPEIPGWCMETLYRPGSSVGGDFYDVVTLNRDQIGLVIADAAGHGVAAAMLSVLCKLRLKQIDEDGRVLQPRQVLEELNARLYEMLSAPGAFVTAVYILLDLRSGSGRIASAGHPPCLVSTGQGDTQRLKRTGPALGLQEQATYTEHSVQLQPGDRLMLYTDGVIEGGPRSPDVPAMAQALPTAPDRQALLTRLFDDAVYGLGGDRDDITMLLLERAEGDSHFDDSMPPQSAETIKEPAAAEPLPDAPHLLQGIEADHAFISVTGAITWLCSQALLNSANALLQHCDQLTVDLSRCEHMDSTCLGTLHEIVTSHEGSVDLQGVSESVRQLFEELSMSAVLAHISAQSRPLPSHMSLIESATLSPQQQGARILRAHESLANLSEANRSQFQAVVDSLRADLGKDD